MKMKTTSLDRPIGRGRTADVYFWDDGHILKLFHNWFPLEDVEYELKIARAVHASGVKSPAVGDIIQVDGRNGLIYERAAGTSMLEMFQRKPWRVFLYARIFAQLHAQMHETVFDADVPTLHGKLQRRINRLDILTASLKTSLLDALHALRQPEADRVCHGDFHPANVLVSEGNANVIDWMDASRGNPLADVARTSIVLLGAAESEQIPNRLQKTFVKVFHSIYLRWYFYLRPSGQEEYHRWLPIVAAARLDEGIKELEQWLMIQAKRVE
jgi:uncharacterized protein (TIGR02172 family)